MTILVTGGQGFLGRRIIEMLRERGQPVRAVVRRPAPELKALGAEVVMAELTDMGQVEAAARGGLAGVIHCAAKSGVWGRFNDFVQANLTSTTNLMLSARRNGAAWFVQTSSPSVVHTGAPLEGVDESSPYLTDSRLAYPYTKMLAEKMVLAANAPDFKTLALRPHLIWGPGDPHFMPRLLDRAQKNRLWLFKGQAKVDSTYIDNAAWAHVLAVEKLQSGADLGGRAYFIAQGEPLLVHHLIDKLLSAASGGAELKVRGLLPKTLGTVSAAILETLWRLFDQKREPPLTRFVLEELTLPHWFDLSRARADLGYEPLVGLEEGLDRLAKAASGRRRS